MQTRSGSQVIVAVTGEGEAYDAVRRRASELAAGGAGSVILYDIDAAGVFASPVPTAWSGEGEAELLNEEAVHDRLDAKALDTAGRGSIAQQVRELEATGIAAWGWLPTTRDAAAIAAYAERQGASLVLVPKDLEQPGLMDRVLGNQGATEANSHTEVTFETVG